MRTRVTSYLVIFSLLAVGSSATAHRVTCLGFCAKPVVVTATDIRCSRWRPSKLFTISETGDRAKFLFHDQWACALVRDRVHAALAQSRAWGGWVRVRLHAYPNHQITAVDRIDVVVNSSVTL